MLDGDRTGSPITAMIVWDREVIIVVSDPQGLTPPLEAECAQGREVEKQGLAAHRDETEGAGKQHAEHGEQGAAHATGHELPCRARLVRIAPYGHGPHAA